MTKEKKINILWDMMILNFTENFGRKGICMGLCSIYTLATDYSMGEMRNQIPELEDYRTILGVYWWPHKGRFIPWWERHKAIWKTIKKLKKS